MVSLWTMCSILLWVVDIWLDCGLRLDEGCVGPVESAGFPASVPAPELPRMAPSELLPGPQSYQLCQVGRALWSRRGLPDTSPHGDSGAGPGGFWGLAR